MKLHLADGAMELANLARNLSSRSSDFDWPRELREHFRMGRSSLAGRFPGCQVYVNPDFAAWSGWLPYDTTPPDYPLVVLFKPDTKEPIYLLTRSHALKQFKALDGVMKECPWVEPQARFDLTAPEEK